MYKQFITGLALIATSLTFGQVGIQTQTPHASSDLELGSTNKTLYLNRVANPEADIANPQPGMVLYDTTLHCLRVYQGAPAGWSDCLTGVPSGGSGTGSVSGLTCGAAVFSPSTATAGQLYTGTLTVPYTGGNGGNYTAVTFSVNGLNFFLPPGNFNTANGSLTYYISGTPATAGTVAISINIGGQSCSGATALNFTVLPVGAYPSSTVNCTAPTAVVDVTNPVTGRTWMDRNLGASRAATSANDTQALGDLYQWGRPADGHQCRNSQTVPTFLIQQSDAQYATSDIPGHNKFILVNDDAANDWRDDNNHNRWAVNPQGPCPAGYRLPSAQEWQQEVATWPSQDAYASSLKLVVAGARGHHNGVIYSAGSYYWTYEPNSSSSNVLYGGTIGREYRAAGLSVRCIKN